MPTAQIQAHHRQDALPNSVLDLHGMGFARGAARCQDLSLQVQAGQRWVLLGNNASGKSTLLHALAGLEFTDGAIALQGTALHRYTPASLAAQRSLLLQSTTDTFDWQVSDWLALHAPTGRLNLDALHRDALALDVAHLLQRPITALSGGERQRVGLLSLSVANTPLWLLDEPVSAQDPKHQQLCALWLADQSTCQRALIFSAHDVNWAAQLATHAVALLPNSASDNAVVQAQTALVGTASEVFTAHNLQRIYGVAWETVAIQGGSPFAPRTLFVQRNAA